MTSLLEPLARVRSTVAWGEALRDRVRIATYYGLLLASKPLRPGEGIGEGMHPRFWLGDVVAGTPAGRFHCRASTTDFDIVNPNYEPRVYEALLSGFSRAPERGVVFVDVGAHIGKYTVFAARWLGDRGTVVAVEPDPENFALLRENVALNGLANVRAVNVGCWSEDGTRELHRQVGNLGEPSFVVAVGTRTIRVPVRTLDSILAELDISQVDAVKMDVQKAELQVLRGATGVLTDPRTRTIVIEEMDEPQRSEPLAMLRAQGFDVSRLDTYNFLAHRPD